MSGRLADLGAGKKEEEKNGWLAGVLIAIMLKIMLIVKLLEGCCFDNQINCSSETKF